MNVESLKEQLSECDIQIRCHEKVIAQAQGELERIGKARAALAEQLQRICDHVHRDEYHYSEIYDSEHYVYCVDCGKHLGKP